VTAKLVLRPFEKCDFSTLVSWVPTPDALAQWCAAFFAFPLDEAQLSRYLDSAKQPHARDIFTAIQDGESVGHVEVSMIWPHMSCRLSRVLIAPRFRGSGIGRKMVSLAVAHAFNNHHAARIDLGVSDDNQRAINCYCREGFAHAGTWPHAINLEGRTISVYRMTLTRSAWLAQQAHPVTPLIHPGQGRPQ